MRARYWMGVVLIAATALPARAQVTLAWKWKEGDVLYAETISKAKQSINFGGNAMATESERRMLDSFRVNKVTDGSVVLTETIESAKIKVEGGAGGGEMMEQVLQKMEGSKFTVTLDLPQRKVVKVEGAEAAAKKAIGDNPLMRQMMGGVFSEDTLRNSLEELFLAYLPGKPVKEGDTWTRKSRTALGPLGGVDIDSQFTYRGKVAVGDKQLDKIESTSRLKYIEPKKPAAGAAGFGFTKGNMKFQDAKATYYFDAQAGRLVQVESRFGGKGKLTVSAMGQEVEVDVDMEQSTQGKVLDRKPTR